LFLRESWQEKEKCRADCRGISDIGSLHLVLIITPLLDFFSMPIVFLLPVDIDSRIKKAKGMIPRDKQCIYK
jgi:hypothetical protein